MLCLVGMMERVKDEIHVNLMVNIHDHFSNL